MLSSAVVVMAGRSFTMPSAGTIRQGEAPRCSTGQARPAVDVLSALIIGVPLIGG